MTLAEIAVFEQSRNHPLDAQALIARATIKVLGIECDHKLPNYTSAFVGVDAIMECSICLERQRR